MPIKETLETFGHFIREADKLKIAYVVLLRYDPRNKLQVDGQFLASKISLETYHV